MTDNQTPQPKIKVAKGGVEKPDEILVAEFNYIAQTAFQANEDRARVTNFFMVSLGGLIAAIFSGNIEGIDEQSLNIGFSIFFFLLTLQGYLTILQLAKLRKAWFSSLVAMNKIKSYLSEKYVELKEFQVFEWNENSLPKGFDTNSVGFYLVVQVAIFSGVTAAGSAGFLSFAIGRGNFPLFAALAFVIICIFLILKYRSMLIKQ